MSPERLKSVWDKVAAAKTRARCEACGQEMMLRQGMDFVCNYCGNAPEAVRLASGYAVLENELPFWFS